MRKIYKIVEGMVLSTILGTMVASCNLDVVPTQDISAETYWKTEKDAWYNLNAIYSGTIPEVGVYNDTYSDDVYCQYSWESSGYLFMQNGLSSANDTGWNFESIRKCNLYLEYVDKCSMDDNLKARFKAEVRVLRAMEYLNLTLRFGKVPVLETVLAYNAPNVSRDEVSKVREFILRELGEASNALPKTYAGGYPNEKGRITKYAALSLKARAALYFGDYATAESTAKDVMTNGGYSLFKLTTLSAAQQKEADEMEQYIDFSAKNIDKDKFIKGMFSYEALWADENGTPDNPEYILTRQYTASNIDYEDWIRYTAMRPNQMGGWSSVSPTQQLVDAYWTVDGKTLPTLPTIQQRADAYALIKKDLDTYMAGGSASDVRTFNRFVHEKMTNGTLKNYAYIEEFRNRDSRMYASILTPFKTWYETDMEDSEINFAYQWMKKSNNESATGFNFRKMVETVDPNSSGSAAGDVPVLRYAEVLLIFAEAHTQTIGYDGEVQSALNLIRDRCGMPSVPATFGSKDDAINFIRQERRIELAAEGCRSADITRYESSYWKKCMNDVKLTTPDGEEVLTMKWDDRMRLRPIPTGAMDMNVLLKSDQNPGY